MTLSIHIISNSGHDGDTLTSHGTLQDALDAWVNENDNQADNVTIVIRKDWQMITRNELSYIPKPLPDDVLSYHPTDGGYIYKE